jgi:hypothetical protein
MFSHELIRQTLLSDVSAVKRERLHLQTAQAVSRLYSDDLEAHAGISPITCPAGTVR